MVAEKDAGGSAVLVVEDESLIRLVIVEALEDAGFEVRDMADGDEALRELEKSAGEFCAVVSDVNMPGATSGVCLANHARENWPWIGVILVSGRPRPSDAELPHGTRFIPKPFALHALVAQVRELGGDRR